MMKQFFNPEKSDWEWLLKRPMAEDQQTVETVRSVINEVKLHGDKALVMLTEKFDHWNAENLTVSESEIRASEGKVSEKLKDAILLAKSNIEKFHASQKEEQKIIETSPGIFCWRKSIGIEKAGLYIPGGTAPLFSTLLMLAVPAQLAGCKEIIVCSPAMHGKMHPALLYTASLLKIKTIYKVGGAQAIAAMAYGTETIPKVNKIFGPGNRFVTQAKQIINGEGIAIDMPAGPSEVAIFADESCHASFVAADLLSQAEHGTDSQVLLVTTSEKIAENVLLEMRKQLDGLSRKIQMTESLKNSKCIVMADQKECFDLLNEYAPEHLIIASENAVALSEEVCNAGSVFLGNYSPESAGDYISGTNHTLPTNGYAKAYSGVSLDSFLKKITFQQLTPDGLGNVKNAISEMAEAEGLPAHKNAVLQRFQ